MKRTLMSTPEPFSLLPILSLLPSMGDVSKLPAYSSSLFARLEAVRGTAGQLGNHPEADRDVTQRLRVEEAMLTTVFDWLASVGEVNDRSSE